MGELILIGGGVRSGKSRFALRLARHCPGPRTFLATAEPSDDEMRARIEQHRRERGPEWTTIEEPRAVLERLGDITDGVVVLDCLTLWLANMLLEGAQEQAMLDAVQQLACDQRDRRYALIVVTNEVGMSVVPDTPVGRAFRDVAGRANALLGRAAGRVYLMLLGQTIQVKPEVAALAPGDIA